MPQISEAAIASEQPARIAKRLLNHWKHKFETAEESNEFIIFMPGATIRLAPQEQHLQTRIIALNADTDVARLEQVVLDHLIRMGQESLQAEWQRREQED